MHIAPADYDRVEGPTVIAGGVYKRRFQNVSSASLDSKDSKEEKKVEENDKIEENKKSSNSYEKTHVL